MENIELECQINEFVGLAGGCRAIDQGTLARASELLLGAKELEEKVKDFFAPLKAKSYAAWKEICGTENRELSKLRPVIDALSRSIAYFKAEQERKRREAELERIRAEQERKRLEEEALRKAQEAEERARQAQLRATASFGSSEIRAQASEEAAKARAEADMILARAAEEEKKITPAAPVPEAPQTQGLAMRENWEFEIVDEAAIPREYLVPDEVKIRKVVRIMKDRTSIPGIRAFNRPIMQRIGIRSDQAKPS